jgi:putative oxidoreductase
MAEDFGKLVLRLTVGGLLLFHGVHKLLNGLLPIRQMLEAHNIPDWIAYGVYFGELVAPVLIVLGLFSRLGGALVVVNMLVAVLLVQSTQLLTLAPSGGYGLELEAFYLFGGLAIALLGAGRLRLGPETWN